MSISDAEYSKWTGVRDNIAFMRRQALLAESTTAVGGSKNANVSAAYQNQQDGDFKDELKIDAGYSIIPADIFEGNAAPQGFPETAETEQSLLGAALNADELISDTIPAQVQLAMMQAARKAHNNWRQRRQQLLTHAQMKAANQLAIAADLAKLAAGENLDGIDVS